MQPKEIVAQFFEALGSRDGLERAAQLVAKGRLTHQLRSDPDSLPATCRGPDALRRQLAAWRRALPDLRITVEDSVADDSRVVTWLLLRGTHQGSWLGIPPTGRSVTIRCVVMQRVEGGRIVEEWVLTETLGMFQQLGVVESTPVLLCRAVPGRVKRRTPPPDVGADPGGPLRVLEFERRGRGPGVDGRGAPG